MRLILLPNGVEHQVVKKMQYDAISREILNPQGRRQMNIVICQDGRGCYKKTCPAHELPEALHLQDLYTKWGHSDVTIFFWHFSFCEGSVDTQKAILAGADVFYFCGTPTPFVDELLDSVFRDPTHRVIIDYIKERVQYYGLVYIGICGGAILFGKSWIESGSQRRQDVSLFDFLDGVSLQYDANVSPGHVQYDTSQTTFQMTTGCGIAFLIDAHSALASSFAVVKNSAQWLDFAAANATLLTTEAQRLRARWQRYMSPDIGIWWYCLDGRCYFEETQQLVQIVGLGRHVQAVNLI